MKPNRHLTKFIVRDLEKFSGIKFAYDNGITRAEAAELEKWARTQPQLVAAWTDKHNPNHAAVRMYVETVRYFQGDHPQTPEGEPGPWPQASAEELRPVPDNPFGVKTAGEAAALLAWSQTHPEYRNAYTDKSHPLHGDYVAQTQELLSMIHGSVAPASGDAGTASPAMSDQAPPTGPANRGWLARIADLQKAPAYLDKQHPGHAEAVAAVTAAYSAAYPEPALGGSVTPATAPAGAAPARATGAPAPHQGRIRELQAHPAYVDKSHPEHRASVEAVRQAYAAAYPEPAGKVAAPA
jgi:hypothetical protein